jgi:quinohemoprotein ethanol dehydrogenase
VQAQARRRVGILGLAASLTACGDARPADVDLERLRRDSDSSQWLALGRNWRGDRFSPLTRIDTANVSRLGLAWEYDFRSRRGRVEFGQESTPIVVDGVMYASGPWGVVVALDAATGRERWRYDPAVDGSYSRRACCSVVNRGALVWRGRVYVGTLDGFLVALDAATGKELWRADTFIDRTRFYTITSPPQIANDKVVIGNSGAEFGVRGYVTAYDAESGRFAWRFFTVPGDPENGFEHPEMELAAKTWDPKSDWSSGLGGTVWGEMSYDPELDLLYVGTGNASPYPIWFRSPSGGDNLFLVSILAIRPRDGRLVWHYQQVPGEMWDFTATSNMIFADLPLGGRVRKVLMQAPKNGFFYVLDRATGELLSAKNFVYQNWALSIDSVTGRPVMNPAANYQTGPKVVYPTQAGAHNWQPMAYSPHTGLVYIPAREQAMVVMSDSAYTWRRGDVNTGSRAIFPPMPKEYERAADGEPERVTNEQLIAWDPLARRARWRVPLGNATFAGGGVLATGGGLVFQGNAAGDLVAYHASGGARLTNIATGTGIMAAPVSYEIRGEQYVAVVAGFGGGAATLYEFGAVARERENHGRILAFKLGGAPIPLPPKRPAGETPEPPPLAFDSDSAARRGEVLFRRYCLMCHAGRGDQEQSAYPQLVRMSAATHAAFDTIVLGGRLTSAGMASFADVLSPADARAIHSFLWRTQRTLWRAEQRSR